MFFALGLLIGFALVWAIWYFVFYEAPVVYVERPYRSGPAVRNAPTFQAPPPVVERQYFYHGGVPYYTWGGYYYNPTGVLIDNLIMLSLLESAYGNPAMRIYDPAVINEVVIQNDPIQQGDTWAPREDAQFADSPIAMSDNGDPVPASTAIQSFDTSDYSSQDNSSSVQDFNSPSLGSRLTDLPSSDSPSVSDFEPASSSSDSRASSFDDSSSSSSSSWGSSSDSSSSSSSSSSYDSGSSSSYDSGSSSSFDSSSSSSD